jgi:hypothetical protein
METRVVQDKTSLDGDFRGDSCSERDSMQTFSF